MSGEQGTWYPCRSQVTEWRNVGQDTLVLHLTLKQYHILNHVAGRIWSLCDGTRSSRDIAEELARNFSTDADAVLSDVTDTLKGFGTMGILDAGSSS
ncbi:PqqD family protein [Roseibium marinum]|uniref:Pyrroloquinoline quinone biosynthesis protein D n=1 Tax=Roseibium marinum TaxID=281252 RepID=A0A2S3UPN3_9HYPH|nr:PqqD family protein [Roseibium marinum]POF29675.1 pyrroloquinoline quinone biosynthesis protein D [Roseibium marinum]